MKLKVIFERLGFKKNAHKIYETLLSKNNQPMSISQLAILLGITRQEVYRNINSLTSHEFIKKTMIGKRSYYSAHNPKRIKKEFEKISEDVSKSIAIISHKEEEKSDDIKYMKGANGIRFVFDDVIGHTPKGGTFYRYTSERDLDKVNSYLSKDYRSNRDKKKLERLVISNPVSGKQKRPRLERFIKFIPPEVDLFNQNIIQLVYGDRLAFINLNKEEAFIIEDKFLADFQKVIFKQLYKKL